jgi:capsular polysaccharide biosynthesis protein
VRDALAPSTSVDADARVFISRAGSKGRQLVGEDKLLPILARYGFEIVQMEELSWSEQLALMQRTKVLVGPHGAGLTNMMFCPPGATIIEIADPLYPNPNFYALACAMAHAYGLVPARSVGENGHRLYRDLELDPSLLETTLELACR